MSRIKINADQIKRAPLNTTINEQVLNDFKMQCKSLGLPMNMLVESFMRQFNEGEFILKVGKANKIIVDIDDSENQ